MGDITEEKNDDVNVGEAEEDVAIAADPQDKKGDSTEKKDEQHSYEPAPKELPGFPGAGKGKYHPESGRKRWINKNGDILEWDSQHGEVEVYDKGGRKHKGAFDPKTGKKVGPIVGGRKTYKFTPVGLDPVPAVKIQIGIYIGIRNAMNRIKNWWDTPSSPCNCE